ncbi:acyltransferase [Flavobacterium amniphilum]|uniref:acyltransferase family protein n=1 Tax=Flavobacterium amniphilum TaxID=1834035 RepID=UPI00202A0DED|nr:acyltransferase family protein [Flavobacterium amniphilum]MCL9807249.1 acyltransferase [Flavobacterium amniphilum]
MRNNNIDILKIIMAFLVVALHMFPVTKLKGLEGLISYEIASGITRIAVPTFFLISGYFLRNKLNDTVYLWKYAKRILLLYVVWQILYLPDLLHAYRLGWFKQTGMILKLVYGYWHLWYLLATVLAVGLLYTVRNCSLKTKWTIVTILLTIGYVFQIAIQADLLHRYLNVQFVYELMGTSRNYLFFALPMLLIGTLYESWKRAVSKLKSFYIPLWIVLFVEVGLYYAFKVKAMDFLIVLPLLSMLTFHIAHQAKSVTTGTVSSTLSLGIYLTHPYAIRLVSEFLPQKTFGIIVVKYFLVCLTAILFWWILDKINKKIPYLF